MINLIRCFRFLNSFNLIKLVNEVTEDVFSTAIDCDHNFEQLFKWKSFDNGFSEAKLIKKPIFFLIYKLGCPACDQLKEKFSKSVRLMDLTDRFVMIKLEAQNNKILNKEKFQPDGKYVPRILFFNSDGNLIVEAYNRHQNADQSNKYFYKNPSEIVETMLFVLKEYYNEPLPMVL
ncbi:thioredoxin domain-containing protein 12 [Nomia melanderi]|uniref:thioredoxin domain-containing protein 12 n=1 Tax=Nomia melanderi TaxID=2448451 RepID=UPI00130412EC|nr:thioredoxin domain-containing protein 12-like [Nomia melanderi]